MKENKIFQKVDKISFYLDNSYSMSRENNKKFNLLDQSKLNAKQIISQLDASQKVFIITNDFEKKHQKWYLPEEAIKLIDSIKPSPNQVKLENMIRKYEQFTDTAQFNSLYVFSDFQKDNNIKPLTLSTNHNIKIGFLHSNHKLNISIDSCYFKHPIRQPNQLENIFINLTNHGPEDIRTQATLFINKTIKATHNIDIPAYTSITEQMHYINPKLRQSISGYIQIDDPLMEFDNKIYFSYSTKEKITVSTINDTKLSHYLENIFSDSLFTLNSYNIDQIDYMQISKNNLLVLDQVEKIPNTLALKLQELIYNGTRLLLFPNRQSNLEDYNNFLNKVDGPKISNWTDEKNELAYINYKHPVFDNVFKQKIDKMSFPIVDGYFRTKNRLKSKNRDILKFINGELFFSEYIYGKGSVYICLSDLNVKHNNFAKHGLFVPIIYNTAIIQHGMSELYNKIKKETIIQNNEIKINDIVQLTKDVNFDLTANILASPNTTLMNFGNDVNTSGTYNLITNNVFTKKISFNYERNESKMQFFNIDEIKNVFHLTNYKMLSLNDNLITKNYSENNNQKKLEYFFIIIAIILMGIELILLRLWN
ncbi:hypothetical protein OAJ42_00415 [Flavobacteriales bacterium]|nr:hypothetical protein [Flavobacteriales bacterium]